MSEPMEVRATDQEMEKVKRYWSLPEIQLGPGAVAHLHAANNMTVSFIAQEPHCAFKVHSHESEEIVIVLEGERDEILDGKLYRIKAGDVILEIDDNSTAEMSLEEAVLRIRGPKGTLVRLLVLHKDETIPEEIEIIRAEIELASVYFEMREDVAYIIISYFSERTNEEIIQLAKSLSPDAPMTREKVQELSKQGLFISEGSIGKRFGGLMKFYEACGWYKEGEALQGRNKITIDEVLGQVSLLEL